LQSIVFKPRGMQKFLYLIIITAVFFGCNKTEVASTTYQSAAIRTFSTDAGLSLSSMEQTKDGGFIFAGHALPGPGQHDAGFLIKTDSKGNIQWQKFYGDSGVNIFKTARQTSDGGFLAVGATTSLGYGLTRKDYYSDAWMLKTDASGNMLWQKTFGNIYNDSFVDVVEMPDQSIFAVGTVESYSATWGAYVDEFYMVKTDKNGDNALPHVTFTQYFSCGAKSIALAPDGSVGIAGKIASSANPGWAYYPVFAHISSDGIFLISSAFWAEKSHDPLKLIAVSDGFVFGLNLIQTAQTNADVFKINPEGVEIWDKSFAGNLDFSNISKSGNGGLILTGNDFDGGKSAQVLQIDSNGILRQRNSSPISSLQAFNLFNTFTINSLPTKNGWAIAVAVTPTFSHRNCSFALIFTDQNGKIITND